MEKVLEIFKNKKFKDFNALCDCNFIFTSSSLNLCLADTKVEDILRDDETHKKLLTNCEKLLYEGQEKEYPEYIINDIEKILEYLIKDDHKGLLDFFDKALISAGTKEDYIDY
ncbi:MAG: hypothetical protein K2I72_03790, partial [Bacilli bacterium]|nr:hypothetical protein [Bacilli bacterium]